MDLSVLIEQMVTLMVSSVFLVVDFYIVMKRLTGRLTCSATVKLIYL